MVARSIIFSAMNGKDVSVHSAPDHLPPGEAAGAERLAALAWDCFADHLPPRDSAPEPLRAWFAALLALFAPTGDDLDQLPAKCGFVFGFDSDAARATQENSAILSVDSARTVLAEFADRARAHAGPVRPEDLNLWMSEIEAATGARGDELAQPIRIALTGEHSGPEFEQLLPLIEDGAAAGLGLPSVRERIEHFVGV